MVVDTALICSETTNILRSMHDAVAVPALYTIFPIMHIIILIVGLVGFDTGEGKLKFFMMWLIALAFNIFVLIFFINSPNSIQTFYDYIINITL